MYFDYTLAVNICSLYFPFQDKNRIFLLHFWVVEILIKSFQKKATFTCFWEIIRKLYIFYRHRFSFYDVDAGSILDNVDGKVAFFVTFRLYFDYLVNILDGHPHNTVAFGSLAGQEWTQRPLVEHSADAAFAVVLVDVAVVAEK